MDEEEFKKFQIAHMKRSELYAIFGATSGFVSLGLTIWMLFIRR